VDDQRGILWAASHKTLYALGFDGDLRFTVPVPWVNREGKGRTCIADGIGGDVCVDKDGKKGKPQTLVFEYTGLGCAGSNNSQSGKAGCSGSVDGASIISLRISKGHYLQPSQYNVALGDQFTVTARKGFPSEIVLDLISEGLKESNTIHTSCSKPLAVGDQFGSLLLVGFTPSAGHDRAGYGGKDDDWNKKGDEDKNWKKQGSSYQDKGRGEKEDRDNNWNKREKSTSHKGGVARDDRYKGKDDKGDRDKDTDDDDDGHKSSGKKDDRDKNSDDDDDDDGDKDRGDGDGGNSQVVLTVNSNDGFLLR